MTVHSPVEATQYICFIHGQVSGDKCPECPDFGTFTWSDSVRSVVEGYIGARTGAIAELETALRLLNEGYDRRAYRHLDRAAEHLREMKVMLGVEGNITSVPKVAASKDHP